MKRLIRRLALTAPLGFLLVAAGPLGLAAPPLVQQVAGSCGAADAEARQRGGEVIGSPWIENRGGQQVCVARILIRKPDGPPVRTEITFPPS